MAKIKWHNEKRKVSDLLPYSKNPRRISPEQLLNLKKSLKKFNLVEIPAIDTDNRVIAGHQRLKVLQLLGRGQEIIDVRVPNRKLTKKEFEQYLLTSNRVTGEWDFSILATDFGESFLADVGFSSEDLDRIFGIDENPEVFDLEKELRKLKIEKIETKPGDIYQIGSNFRLMNGDSMIEADVLKLMNGEKADMCFTDPPYLLDYLHGKKKKKSTEGFGYKRDRRYLGTDSLPENFTDLWMANVAKVQKPDFSIIVFENPKNLRTIWNSLEVYWKYRNTITWHLPNRVSGFAAKYKFFNKHDIALVGTKGNIRLNTESETDELFQNEYENALYATSGKPHFESYEKGKKICPTDFL